MKKSVSDLFYICKNRSYATLNLDSGHSPSPKSAFTIVELLVVIVVIGILAAITIVSYTGISGRATTASLQLDLTNASTQLKMFQVDNSAYPTTINCTIHDSATNKCVKLSNSTTYQYISNNNIAPQTFCLVTVKNGQSYNIAQDSISSSGGKNFISESGISSYTSYNTIPTFNADHVLTTVFTSPTASYLAINVSGFIPGNEEYTVSGVMKKNGAPVTRAMWGFNKASTYAATASKIIVDDATGRFEITQLWSGNSVWIIHTDIIGMVQNDIITIDQFKFEKGNVVTCWVPAP